MKPEPISDEQIDAEWRSVDYTQPYEAFRMAVGRAIEAAVNAKWEALLAAQPEPSEFATKAMELATDFAVCSLRVGSYERKDSYENSYVASWQTVDLRKKMRESKDRLHRHLFAQPVAQPIVGKATKTECEHGVPWEYACGPCDREDEEPVAQPVAWQYLYSDGCWRYEYTWNGSSPIESRALYAAPVMYKNPPDLDTSQERVKNLEESNQMLLEALKESLRQLEEWEVKIDGEWGDCRSLEELDTAGELSIATRKARAAIEQAERTTP